MDYGLEVLIRVCGCIYRAFKLGVGMRGLESWLLAGTSGI